MNTLKYVYEVDGSTLAIDDLCGGLSVLVMIDQVLAEIESEIGPLQTKYILWRGDDDRWDLLLPKAPDHPLGMAIYPLGARELSVAKVKLQAVVRAGLIPGIIP